MVLQAERRRRPAEGAPGEPEQRPRADQDRSRPQQAPVDRCLVVELQGPHHGLLLRSTEEYSRLGPARITRVVGAGDGPAAAGRSRDGEPATCRPAASRELPVGHTALSVREDGWSHARSPPPLPGAVEKILALLPVGRWDFHPGPHRRRLPPSGTPPSYVVGDAHVAADPQIHGHDRSDPGSLAAVTHDRVAVGLCSAGAYHPGGWAE